VQRVSAYENQFAETMKEKFHRVQHLRADSSDYDSDQDISVAECQEQEDSLLPVDQGGPKDFDVNKADQIFDLLLQEG
jgi:hypothetical protein